MIRNLILAALITVVAGTVCAQTTRTEETVEYSKDKYVVETNHFWDNWFVTLGAGGQVYFGDHDKRMDFKDRIAPALDIAVGKWFDPTIGMRLMYSGLQIKGLTQTGIHSTGEVYKSKEWLDRQKFKMFDLHYDAMVNFSNLFAGYVPNRFWNFTAYVGVGWMYTWEEPRMSTMAANIGIINSFRLCKALDFNVDVRGIMGSDTFDGENGGRQGEGMLNVTCGFTYKFKAREWNRSKTITRHTYADLSSLNSRLDSLERANRNLQEQLDQKPKETIVKGHTTVAPVLITFDYAKSKLSNEARVNLSLLADILNKDNQIECTITGYADSGTGSSRTNDRLSRERAQAVYDCLVKEFKVPESQLHVDYKGGVENMFYNDPRLSRAVITTSK